MIQIKHRYIGAVMLEVDTDTLYGANLRGANLSEANLSEANLREANLREANLREANLREADLSGADLYGADLYGANLYGANLYGANLSGANLSGADLRGADLRGADLRGEDLRGADLRGADLSGAYLRGADLSGADLPHFLIVPEQGSFIAYKKLSLSVIVALEIPADAQRTNSLISRKCRASKVKVLEVIENPSNVEFPIKSTHYGSAVYEPGTVIEADSYDGDIRAECTHGIHFFMTLREAQEWS